MEELTERRWQELAGQSSFELAMGSRAVPLRFLALRGAAPRAAAAVQGQIILFDPDFRKTTQRG